MPVLDWRVIRALASRTFRQSIESPSAYVLALLYYGFVGGIYGIDFLLNNQASIQGLSGVSPWILWVIVPGLTMGLISDEIRSGTFEQLSTLPLRDEEIVLGKFAGFAMISGCLTLGLLYFVAIARILANPRSGMDMGSTFGVLAGIYLMMLTYGAMGLFASSLSKHQVVASIVGSIFCTALFIPGQFTSFLPAFLAPTADFLGIVSHVSTISHGVWDFRDALYFASVIGFFLYLAIIRLSTRRF